MFLHILRFVVAAEGSGAAALLATCLIDVREERDRSNEDLQAIGWGGGQLHFLFVWRGEGGEIFSRIFINVLYLNIGYIAAECLSNIYGINQNDLTCQATKLSSAAASF
jgi:hypothetical protein